MLDVVVALLDLVWVVLLVRVVAGLVTVVVPLGVPGHDLAERVRCGLSRLTEPVLAPLRRGVPTLRRGPLVVDLPVLGVLLAAVLLRVVLRG